MCTQQVYMCVEYAMFCKNRVPSNNIYINEQGKKTAFCITTTCAIGAGTGIELAIKVDRGFVSGKDKFTPVNIERRHESR